MAKEYKNKKGATGKKYTTVGDVIKVTYTDGSTRVVRPTDASYKATKDAMEKDIGSKKWYKPAGNSKTTAQTALGAKSTGAGVVTTAKQNQQNEQYKQTMQKRRAQEAQQKAVAEVAKKEGITTPVNRAAKGETAPLHTFSMNAYAARVPVVKDVKNDRLTDALSHGARTGANTAISGIKTGLIGAGQTVADIVGADDLANDLASQLRLASAKQQLDQQRIDAQYNTNFGGAAKLVSDVTAGAVGMLPTIGSFVLLPSGKIAAAGKVAQLGTKAIGFAPLALQSGGGGINQALNEGATIEQAKMFGLGSMAKELGTEIVFGGIPYVPGFKNLGDMAANMVKGETAKKVAGAAGKMAGEGIEEAAATYAEPFIERATYNEDAENASLKDAAYAGLVGGLTAGVLNAGAKAVPNHQKMVQNDYNRAFEALHGQKMVENQPPIAQNAQNSPQQAQNSGITNTLPRPEKAAQNQNMQADFAQNPQKNSQTNSNYLINDSLAKKYNIADEYRNNLVTKNKIDALEALEQLGINATVDFRRIVMPKRYIDNDTFQKVREIMTEAGYLYDNYGGTRGFSPYSNPRVWKSGDTTSTPLESAQALEIVEKYGAIGEKIGDIEYIYSTPAVQGIAQEMKSYGFKWAEKKKCWYRKVKGKSSAETLQEHDIRPTLNRPTLEMSERTFENVGNRKVKAYQQENPEIKPFQQATAEELLSDLQMGVKGGRDAGIDPETRNVTQMGGWQRQQSEPIERMLRDGMSYKQIEDGLQRIVEDNGKENTANAKRVELYVHDAMQNGYNSIVNGKMDANFNYAISQMTKEELEAEAQRLTENLSTATSEEQFDMISSRLDAIENRMNLLKHDIRPTLNRPVQPTTQENRAVEPTVEQSSETVQNSSATVQYEDYDVSQLPKDVFNFYNQVGEVGGKAHFNIRVVQKLEEDAEGRYDGRGNILISAERANDIETVRRVVAHEVYHAMKDTEQWGDIQDLAYELYKLDNPNGTQEQMLQAKIDQYYERSGGKVQLDTEGAWDEIGAELMGKILTDPKMAERIWNQNPTLAQRIKWWLEDMVAKLYDYVTISEENSIYKRALEAYSEGLWNMEYRNMSSETGETRHMFAGVNSKTADHEALARAQQMEADGADTETIRQQTGWNKSLLTADKPTYEIDDSKVYVGKNAPRFPIEIRIYELEQKFLNGTITREEVTELQELNQQKPTDSRRDILMDIMYHPDLYEAYPQLRRMKVKYEDLDVDTAGMYDPSSWSIVLNNNYQWKDGELQETLLHEVQHAVQHIEGLPGGSSTDYWSEELDKQKENVDILQHQLDYYYQQIGLHDFISSQVQRIRSGEIDMEQHWKELEEFKRKSDYGYSIMPLEQEIKEYHNVTKRNPNNLYFNTAGEIMARDTAQRRTMDADQRRQKQPAMGDGNTVYAEGGDNYSIDPVKVREQFSKQVDEVLNGKNFGSSHLLLGKTPKALKYVGFPNLPVFMTAKHVYTMANKGGKYKNTNYHGMGAELVKQLPEAIERPLLIAESNTRDDSVVLLTKLQDKQGQPVIAAVKFNGNAYNGGVEVEANLLTSAYGKKNVNSLFTPQNILYVSKKESSLLDNIPGLQLPNNIATMNFDKNVAQFRNKVKSSMNSQKFDNSARYSLSKDNTGKRLTEQQEQYFKNSKVRDENGNLKKVYHGSPNEFYEFDWNRVGLNGTQEGRGFYFTDDKSISENYGTEGGGGVREFYLKMEKPLNGLKVTMKKAEVKKLLKETDKFMKKHFDDEYFLSNYGDTDYYGKEKVINDTVNNLFEYNNSDSDILYDIINTAGIRDNEDTAAFMKFITEKFGYDGILTEWSNWETGEVSRIYVTFDSNNAKLTDNENPTSNPDIRYSLDAVGSQEYKDLLDEHGSIPEGENPTGENYRVEVPRKAADGKKVREFVRTIMEAPSVDDAVANMFAQELIDPEQVLSGILTMESTANKALVDAANEAINETGWRQNYQDLHKRMTTGDKITAQDVALATRVAQEAQKAGDAHAAFDILTDLTVVASEFGQGLQALKILKRLSPEGQLIAFMKTQKRINDSLKKQKKKTVQTMSEETAEEFLDARGKEKRDEIMIREFVRMGQETEGTWMDKLNALRYAAMLSNPRTHIRNVVGNFMMAVVHQPTVVISAAIEDGVRLARKALQPNGVQAEQYRSLVNRTGNSYKELRDYANRIAFKEVEAVLRAGGSRYSDSHNGFRQYQRVFGHSLPGRALEQLAGNGKFSVSSALEGEDMLAKRLAFNAALAGYMKANGISVQDAINGVVKPNGASIERGKEYAFKQAQKATFTEENRAADALNKLENTNSISKVLMGGLMPFKNTPMNILTRGFEYSPAGIAMTLYKLKYAATNSADKYERAYNMNDVFESLAANMTGTALMYLGYKMAEAGLLAGAGDDDNERKSRYDQLMGSQEYAFTDPDTGESWTIDWLAPVAMPLFAGAEVFNQVLMQNENAGDPDYDNVIVAALGRIIEPVFEMSCMQGVSDALASYSSGGTEFASSVGKTLLTGYAGQFVPQPFSAAARTVDDTVRSTYTSKESDFPVVGKAGEQFLRQQMNNLPVASMTNEPSIDVWGEERKREFAGEGKEQFVKRALNSFFNPTTYSSDKRTELDKELEKLYSDTDGNVNVLPKAANSSFEYQDKTYYMKPQEKTAYDRMKGQKSRQYVSEFVNSDVYNSMDDHVKADVVAELYDLANYEAKKQMLKGRGINDYEISAHEKALASGNPVAYYRDKKLDTYNDEKAHTELMDKLKMDVSVYDDVNDMLAELHDSTDANGKTIKGKSRKDKVYTTLKEQRDSGVITDEQMWYIWVDSYNAKTRDKKSSLPYWKDCPYQWIVDAKVAEKEAEAEAKKNRQ